MKIHFAVLCLFLGACVGAASADIAIRDATVVDVAGGVLVPDQTVLIADNRIVAVGPADEVSIAPDIEVIEGAGGYVIPGLWDMHVHSVGAGDWHFPLFLAHGVTGVREMSDGTGDVTLEVTKSIRRRLAKGGLPGPTRFISAGPYIDGYPPLAGNNPVVVRTAQEARAVVDSLVDAGADFIKPYENLSREAYFAIMDQARRRGIPVDGHVPFRVTAEEAAAAGQRTAEHPEVMAAGCSADAEAVRERFAGVLSDFGSLSESEQFLVQFRLYRAFYDTRDPVACATTIEAFLQHDVAVTMDLVAYHHVVHADEILSKTTRMRLVPQEVRRNWEEQATGETLREFQSVLRPIIPLELENTRLLRDAGVTLLAATDVGVPFQVPGISLHVELERLVEAGLTPLEALQTATLNPARVLDKEDSLGTVEAGKLADLVLLDANPLEDIRNTQQIHAVVADGRLYRRAELDRLLAEVEAPVEQADNQLLPVIDMHLHAGFPDTFGEPQTVCTNREWVEFPPVDPNDKATVQNTSICSTPLMPARDGEDNARQTGELMKEYNTYGVLDVSRDGEGAKASLAHGDKWRSYALGRYWIALDFSDIGLPPIDDLEVLVRDSPIRHPKLRIYVMHYGSPLVEETIEQAPFLTEDEKRGTFHNNAARFLRLSEEEIARHHGEQTDD